MAGKTKTHNPRTGARGQSNRMTVMYKLSMHGLSSLTDKEQIRAYFEERYDSIQDVVERTALAMMLRSSRCLLLRSKGAKQRQADALLVVSDGQIAEAICADEHILDGMQVKLQYADSPLSEPPVTRNRLFVGGLASNVLEGDLVQYFEQFGPVSTVEIVRDHESNRSRGFGFVSYVDEDSAEEALSSGNMHELNSRQVEIKYALPRIALPKPSYADRRRPQASGNFGRQLPVPAWLPEMFSGMMAAWVPAEEHPYWQGNAYPLYHNHIRSCLVRAYHLGVEHALMSCRGER